MVQAEPRLYLDRFMIFCEVVIVDGWCEKFAPGRTCIEIKYNGVNVPTLVEEILKPHLVGALGAGADRWGFTAKALLPSHDAPFDIQPLLSLQITPPGADTIVITNPGAQFVPESTQQIHQMYSRFIDLSKHKGGKILEIGARERTSKPQRPLFLPDLEYVGFDIAKGPSVDVVGDAHHLSKYVAPGFNSVFSRSTFEHLLMPWKVVLEINKVLNDGGLVYTECHQAWPVHEEPWDFLRFSKDAWHGFFNRHTGFEILEARQGEPVYLSAAYPYPGIEKGVSYLGSRCIACKVGEPEVRWEADMAGIYDLQYTHGVG